MSGNFQRREGQGRMVVYLKTDAPLPVAMLAMILATHGESGALSSTFSSTTCCLDGL
jgi:hypothetical protein